MVTLGASNRYQCVFGRFFAMTGEYKRDSTFLLDFVCNGHQEGIPSELRLTKGILMDLLINYNETRLGISLPFVSRISGGFIGGMLGHFLFGGK